PRTRRPRGRNVLAPRQPHLLAEVSSRYDAAVTLSRITPLLAGIVTRTTYLELLRDFPGALRRLIMLCAASPLVARHLARG
ncbi:bifunctional [glutamate--ammonia ligase]-adenylyl-L-tyrosine phosphorylase/[glutamate--ammonia-ligase] adenylyltransferase, partial [Salmonella enterica subsp. enterica serovar Wilhelmsburg]